jgi:hypothetical protein
MLDVGCWKSVLASAGFKKKYHAIYLVVHHDGFDGKGQKNAKHAK